MSEGWITIATGYVRADEIVAITFEEQSYEVERPTKGYSETRYASGVILTLRGGARLVLGYSSEAEAREEVSKLRAEVDSRLDRYRF